MSIDEKAHDAYHALAAWYRGRRGPAVCPCGFTNHDNRQLQETLEELLTDLRHLADAHDLDFNAANAIGQEHYEKEYQAQV